VGKWDPSDPREGRRRRAERSSGYDTRERLCAHKSCHHTPTEQRTRVADALPEEPDALIAHVRVCGRAGWVTTGSTRQGVIRDIGGGTRPPHDQSPLIEQETAFAADNPPVIREAFAAHLLGTPAFAHGVDQLDPIRVDDPGHRRGGQEGPRPVLMGLEETKEAGPLGEPREQRPIVAR